MSDSDVVIRVEGLGKKYSLHHEQGERYTALRDVVARQARAAGRLLNPFTLAGQLRRAQRQAAQARAASEEEFWALKDVSFEIRRGERVGIIGRNGAGKSTLLKILSRITEPSTGRVEIRGRVASLLEVGTGFHPELTGRENIYLNGAILGMTRREIRSKFDEIVDFAEVEKFLDTPVKRYSSGMYVRLAFAVAAHLEPEILVVDEVLAVGDASFQKKCLGKMETVSGQGRTLLFVSHNMAAINKLCSRAFLLKSGRITQDSDPARVSNDYFKANKTSGDEGFPPFVDESGNEIRLKSLKISTGLQGETITTLTPIVINIGFWVRTVSPFKMHCTLHIKTQDGIRLISTYSRPQVFANGDSNLTLELPAPMLNSGSYEIDAQFVKNGNSVMCMHTAAASFDIVLEKEPEDIYLGREPSHFIPRFQWTSHHVLP